MWTLHDVKKIKNKKFLTVFLTVLFSILILAGSAKANYVFYNADTGLTNFSHGLSVPSFISSGNIRTDSWIGVKTDPGYPLHLYNASGETGILTSYGSNNIYISHGGWGLGSGKLGLGSGSTPSLVVDSINNRIGIGSNSPGYLLDVNGIAKANTYMFAAPTGDPSPVITARVVPSGQGASNEKTELILFHANDNGNGSGPDQITLRAPALSFQTYDNAAVSDINNNSGYNERLYVSPGGNVGIGTNNPIAKLEVAGGNNSNKIFKEVYIGQPDYNYNYLKVFKFPVGAGGVASTFNGKICVVRSNDIGVSNCSDVYISRGYNSEMYFSQISTNGGYGPFKLVKITDSGYDWMAIMYDSHLGAGIKNWTIDGVVFNENGIDAVSFTNVSSATAVHSAVTYTSKNTVISDGNVGIGAYPTNSLDIGNRFVVGNASGSDGGYRFKTSGSFDSGSFTEANGTLLSYGINVPQAGTRSTGSVGGIFRLDTRVGGSMTFANGAQSFSILGYPSGGMSSSMRLLVSLQDGTTALVPNGGNVGVGTTGPGYKLDVQGGQINASGGLCIAGVCKANWAAVASTDADTLDGQHGSYYDQRVYNSATNYLGAGYVSGGLEKPNWGGFGPGKLKLQMLSGANIGAPDGWNDVLWMSSYTGGDVKGSNALIFSKYTDRVGFVRQDYDSATWGTYREFITSANISSQVVSNLSTPTSGYKHVGAWGVGRTDTGAILVNTAYRSDIAATADNITSVSSNPNNSYQGVGIRPFYSWDIGQANNASAGYSNGITIGTNPGDQNYGFQIVQNMWDDKLYFRRYNAGWQGWYSAVAADSSGNASVAGHISVGGQVRSSGGVNFYGNGYSFSGGNGDTDGGMFSPADGTLVFATNNVERMRIDSSGNITIPGNITANSFVYSDRALKKNIATIESPLSKILKLRGVTFNWKKDNTPSVGLIAQEVEAVFPELIRETDGVKSVQYSSLVAPLIEAVKEQQQEIENLNNRIKVLESHK